MKSNKKNKVIDSSYIMGEDYYSRPIQGGRIGQIPVQNVSIKSSKK